MFDIASSFNYFWKYFQNEHKFNAVYSRNNFPKIKNNE